MTGRGLRRVAEHRLRGRILLSLLSGILCLSVTWWGVWAVPTPARSGTQPAPARLPASRPAVNPTPARAAPVRAAPVRVAPVRTAPVVRALPAKSPLAQRVAPASPRAIPVAPPVERKAPVARAPEARVPALRNTKAAKSPNVAARAQARAIPQRQPPQLADARRRLRKLNAQSFVRQYWSKGPLIGLLLILFAGFLVSLTPCVYPMIPVTIAVIGASSANEERGRRHGLFLSLMYVLGMAMPYTVLGVVIAFIGHQPIVLGASIFENVWFLGFTVILFGMMSLSMFGLFDMALPSSWQTKMAGYQGKGFLGIFVLGIIGALLATPCSGPVIVGLLSFIAQLSSDPTVSRPMGIMYGAVLPFVFSLGIGVPFLILGGGVTQTLPRSGTWMTQVKKVFGTLLLGATFYYAYFLLSGFREVYILALAGSLVLLGIFSGAFRGYDKNTWWFDQLKQVFGWICLLVGSYMLVAMLMLHGFLVPPIKDITGVSKIKISKVMPAGTAQKPRDPCLPPLEHPEDKPFWFTNEKQAMACAKKLKRPVIIDFWAEWCSACKQLEKESFNHPSVVPETRRFVMIKYEYKMTRPEDKRLAAKYTVINLPLVRFVDSKGNVLDEPRIIGFIKHDQVLELMRKVR